MSGNFKLAEKISKYQKELNKKIQIFIQVNLSNEKHKSGIDLNNLKLEYKDNKDYFVVPKVVE